MAPPTCTDMSAWLRQINIDGASVTAHSAVYTPAHSAIYRPTWPSADDVTVLWRVAIVNQCAPIQLAKHDLNTCPSPGSYQYLQLIDLSLHPHTGRGLSSIHTQGVAYPPSTHRAWLIHHPHTGRGLSSIHIQGVAYPPSTHRAWLILHLHIGRGLSSIHIQGAAYPPSTHRAWLIVHPHTGRGLSSIYT